MVIINVRKALLVPLHFMLCVAKTVNYTIALKKIVDILKINTQLSAVRCDDADGINSVEKNCFIM